MFKYAKYTRKGEKVSVGWILFKDVLEEPGIDEWKVMDVIRLPVNAMSLA